MDVLYKQKSNVKKGGKRMKRAFGILAGLVFCSMVVAAGAMAQTPTTTSQSAGTVIHTVYNAYGVAVSGTQDSTTTTTSTTTKTVDGVTVTETSTTTSKIHSVLEWLGGTLKVVSSTGSNTTTDAAGRVTNTENYTDTYSYNANGDLISVSGSGTTTSTTYDANGVKTGSTSGTLTRTYEVRNGQALLIGQSVNGKIFDKDCVLSGEFTSNTTNTYADYKGGQWVLTQSVTESYTARYDGLANSAAGHNDIGSWTRTTRTTNYTRNAAGTITGISTTMTGTRFDVTGIDGGVVSGIRSTLTSYTANYSFDSTLGWFLADDTQTWTQDPPPPPPAGYDPAATGTVFQGDDGQWYMNVKVWTNEEGTTYETITVTLDLSGLSDQEQSEVVAILQKHAASGDLLTLFGLSQDGTLSNGAILQVLGIGNGPFDSRPDSGFII